MVNHSSLGADPEEYDVRAKREAVVSNVSLVSASLRRITLSGQAIKALPHFEPTGWVKIFLPSNLDADSPGRAYTLRNHRPEFGEVDIEVVLHEAGPLTTWARGVTAGYTVLFAGPRGGFSFNPACEWMLMAGDLSALPAIASIAEVLPPHTNLQVLMAIDNEEDLVLLPPNAKANCRWTKQGDEGLMELIQTSVLSSGPGEVWVAGEASFVRNAQRHLLLERGLDKRTVHCTGYWKRGAQDHKDPDHSN